MKSTKKGQIIYFLFQALLMFNFISSIIRRKPGKMKNISETEEEKLRNLGNGRTVRMRVLVLIEYTNN